MTGIAGHAAKEATSTIPIILSTVNDPVGEGLVASLARPGGNITGLSNTAPDSAPKRLQFAMEVMPGLKRLGLLVEEYPKVESHPQITAELNAFRTLVRDHGVTLRTYEIRSGKDIEGAITAIAKDRTQLVILWNSPLTVVHRNTIIVGVAARGIPIISEGREMAEAGALLTYSPNFFDMWRRSAVYVDKILKGAKPGDLPIEQATKFSLVVNLKTGQGIGRHDPRIDLGARGLCYPMTAPRPARTKVLFPKRGPTSACNGAATAALRLLLRPADARRYAA